MIQNKKIKLSEAIRQDNGAPQCSRELFKFTKDNKISVCAIGNALISVIGLEEATKSFEAGVFDVSYKLKGFFPEIWIKVNNDPDISIACLIIHWNDEDNYSFEHIANLIKDMGY